jgi:hypothetical protein
MKCKTLALAINSKFIIGKNIFANALDNYLTGKNKTRENPNNYHPFMIELDEQFTKEISKDSGFSTPKIGLNLVKALEDFDPVVNSNNENGDTTSESGPSILTGIIGDKGSNNQEKKEKGGRKTRKSKSKSKSKTRKSKSKSRK